jgi:WD40 repeat protein
MVTSTGGGYLSFYNFSTGKEIMSIYVGENRQIKAMGFSSSGQTLYVGCITGDIIWYECVNPGMFTQFQFKGEMISTQKRPINSLCYREYHGTGEETRIPSLLVNPTNSTITLYKITEKGLVQWMVCPIVNKSFTIKSSFSPLLRSKKFKASVVSGSEDGIIYFYSYHSTLSEISGFNNILSLKGHSSPVLDVTWNHDESLLASADSGGVVLIWKRNQTNEDEH